MLGMKLNRNEIRPHRTAYGTPSTSSSAVSARAAAAPSAARTLTYVTSSVASTS